MDRLWVYKFERKKYMKPSFSQRNVNAEDWGRNKKKCFSLVHTIPYSKGFLKFGETEPPPISDWLLWFSISRRGQKAYCSFPNSYWLRDMGALSKTWNGQHSLNPRKKSVFVWNGSEAPRWAQKDPKWSITVRLTILERWEACHVWPFLVQNGPFLGHPQSWTVGPRVKKRLITTSPMGGLLVEPQVLRFGT